MDRLRVAQLSFWFVHAEQFCVEAQTTPNVELAAVWDPDHERGHRKAREYGVRFERDLDDLLDREDIDAVSLCAEPFRHPELVEAAAQAGKHILIEKPMASDLAGARRIVTAVERYGVDLLPAFNLRYHPVAIQIKQLVDEGALGRIWHVRRLHGHSRAYERGNFDGDTIARLNRWIDPVSEHRDSLFFAGSHAALWFQWMFGSPKDVYCASGTVSRNLPVEDHSITVLRYEGGMTGVMECSEALLAQGTVAELYGTDAVIIQLRGSLPSTRVPGASMTPLMIYRRDRDAWEVPLMPPQFLRHEREYSSPRVFFDRLLSGAPMPLGVYDGYDSIAVLVAAQVASSTGHEARVEPWIRGGAENRGGQPV